MVGYTLGMKTAISIPDDVFAAADRLARRLKRTRSDLYRRALSEYLARHAPDPVTEAMDRAVEQVGVGGDDFTVSAARRVLERSEW